jgi:hypothetical protein
MMNTKHLKVAQADRQLGNHPGAIRLVSFETDNGLSAH